MGAMSRYLEKAIVAHEVLFETMDPEKITPTRAMKEADLVRAMTAFHCHRDDFRKLTDAGLFEDDPLPDIDAPAGPGNEED